MNLHLVRILLLLVIAGAIPAALQSDAANFTTTTIGITVNPSGGPAPEEPYAGSGSIPQPTVPPGRGDEGENIPPAPEVPPVTVVPSILDFQPKGIVDRYGYTVKVYGQNFAKDAKLVIGYLQFNAQLSLEGDRQVLAADVAGFALAPGSYRIGVRNPDGAMQTVEGFRVVEGIYKAELISKSPNPVLEPDGTAQLTAVFKNTGNLTWFPNSMNPVRLGTAHPRDRRSNFYENSWVLADRPTDADSGVVLPGQTGTFRFTIKPNFRAAGKTTKEHFALVADHDTWFGPEISWDIKVNRPPSVLERAKETFSGVRSNLRYFTNTTVNAAPVSPSTPTVYASDPVTGFFERLFQAFRSLLTFGR